MNAIKSSYPNGECPDCGEEIPSDVCTGDACSNCEHVFSEQRKSDDPKPSFAEITERLLKTIARSDDEFQQQIANGIGIELDELQDYLFLIVSSFPSLARRTNTKYEQDRNSQCHSA